MKKWLEYETDTGRIVCVLTVEGSDEAPEVQSGHAVIEVPEEWDGDTGGWVIRDGELERVKLPDAERHDAELARREACGGRVGQIMTEFILALLRDDADETASLKAEFRRLEARL